MPKKKQKTELNDPDDVDSDYVLRTRLGYPLDECMSAVQKCVRRGREREVVFWVRELIESGFVRYWHRRIQIIAAEECGTDVELCAHIGQLSENAERSTKGFTSDKQECIIETMQAIALCRAEKSREAIDATGHAYFARKSGWRIQPCDAAIDMHTSRGRSRKRAFRDFRLEGRLLAGELTPDDPTSPTRNDWERALWGERQRHLGRPGQEGAEPDVEVPQLVWPHPEDPNAGPELPAEWLESHAADDPGRREE